MKNKLQLENDIYIYHLKNQKILQLENGIYIYVISKIRKICH